MNVFRRFNPYVCVAIPFEVVGVLLLFDAGLWVSGRVRYMVAFERIFDTPPELATRMRWVQASVALVMLIFGVGIPLLLERRHHKKVE